MTADQTHELERVIRLRGFRYGLHDFLAEVDLDALKKVNNKVEAEYINAPLLDRKTEELLILAACIAQKDEVPHVQIHLHAAIKAGATKEELWAAIQLIGDWVGSIARAKGLEAWRATFRPDLPTIERVVELR
jgi:alkylhydroperoxidase/carboxymuconolactone decarboxylase family protein YurZ